jgi:hypothetical protein
MSERQGGRTLAMVKELPDDGRTVVVVVHASFFIDYVRTMILDVRGAPLLERCRFVVAQPSEMYRLRGVDPDRVFIDHAVWEYAVPSVFAELMSVRSRQAAA